MNLPTLRFISVLVVVFLVGWVEANSLTSGAATAPPSVCETIVSGKHSDDGIVSYAISIVPKSDRTNLNVTISFQGEDSGKTKILLPPGQYGTPNIHESIVDIKAVGASIDEVNGDPGSKVLSHEPGAMITLSYTVTRDPKAYEGYAYRPSVDESHFHYFDSQWRVRPANRQEPGRYRFEFTDLPDEWIVFSNLGHGPGPYQVSSTENDLSAFIAGGNYHSANLEVEGIPVGVYVSRSFAEPERMANAARDIILREGETFGGFDGQFYVVSISPRANIRAGTAIDNAFVCFVDPDTSRVALDVLIAHEVFHNWLPGTGTIDIWKNGTAIDEFRLDWFVEGFTEYVARRVLLDSGRITMDEFVDLFNADLKEQGRNPMQYASLEVVKEAIKDGRYTNQHERTSYFRGPLIALEWDVQLRKSGDRNLLEVVHEFVQQASMSGGVMDEEAFLELFGQHGIDIRPDYVKHIVYGDPPIPAADIFGANYDFEPIELKRLDQGFDTLSTRQTGIRAQRIRKPPVQQWPPPFATDRVVSRQGNVSGILFRDGPPCPW